VAELDAAGAQSCHCDWHGMCRAGRSGRISERASAMTDKDLEKSLEDELLEALAMMLPERQLRKEIEDEEAEETAGKDTDVR